MKFVPVTQLGPTGTALECCYSILQVSAGIFSCFVKFASNLSVALLYWSLYIETRLHTHTHSQFMFWSYLRLGPFPKVNFFYELFVSTLYRRYVFPVVQQTVATHCHCNVSSICRIQYWIVLCRDCSCLLIMSLHDKLNINLTEVLNPRFLLFNRELKTVLLWASFGNNQTG